MTNKENGLLPCPMGDLKSSIAERVRFLRQSRNESLQDVADAVGCSKAHLHDLEKGASKNPSINLLRGLAIHFMVPVAALVENEITAQYRAQPPHNGVDELHKLVRHWQQRAELAEARLVQLNQAEAGQKGETK